MTASVGPLPIALVTGFGAFRDIVDNPSGAAARLLDGRTLGGLRVVGRELPVTYEAVARKLPAWVAELSPSLVVATGVGRGEAVALERWARRHAASTEPDVAGVAMAGAALSPGGPDLRPSTWDAEALAMVLDTPALRVVTSEDAGGYVCNAAFWHVTACLPAGALGGFVHLPPARDGRTAEGYAAFLERLVLHLAAAAGPRTG